MYYAEINSSNTCTSILETPNEITNDQMISIDSYDVSLLGKEYSSDNSAWTAVDTTTEPTDSDIFQAQTLLNQAELISRQSDMDETLAEILLNQIGG